MPTSPNLNPSGSIPGGRILVISDGDLPALVATAIATEETVRREHSNRPPAPLVWAAWTDDAPAELRLAAVRRHAEALGATLLAAPCPARAPGESPGSWQSAVLLRAGSLALEHACRRVVWAVQFEGPAPDEPAPVGLIAEAASRAVLVSRLVSLESERAGLPEVVIETPFVDLSDDQLADLACDLGLSPEDCWWWTDSVTPSAGRARRRWGRVLAGVH